MIRLDRQPTATDLKLFGGSLSLMLTVVGFVVRSQFGWTQVGLTLWIVAGVLCIVYYAFPSVQRPLYRSWLVAMFPLAWVMSVLVLGLVYFGILTPIAILSRLSGRDPLQLHRDAESYWIKRSDSPTPKSRYFRQH